MPGLRRLMDEGVGLGEDPRAPRLRQPPEGGFGDPGLGGIAPIPPGASPPYEPIPGGDQPRAGAGGPDPNAGGTDPRAGAGSETVDPGDGGPGGIRGGDKPRDLFKSQNQGPAGGAQQVTSTPRVPTAPTPAAGQPPEQQYLTQPSVTQPAPMPITLPSPPPQALVNPMAGGGRMFGKQGGLMEGGYGLPDTGQSTNDPSDLLFMLTKLLGQGGGGGGNF